MAKAKKAAAPKAAAKSTKKQAAKKDVTPQAPVIDTALAAQAAARMVAAKPEATDASSKPSNAFKQLKDSLNKPHVGGADNFLNSTVSPSARKSASGLPFGQSKQVGHNQTFGADASRRNLPRRTGG